MHPDQNMQTRALSLPVELYHQIIYFLDIKVVLALRKTCRHFFALTHDPSVWSMLFARLCVTQPLPCSRAEFAAMSPSQAERLLFWASKVEASFLQPREYTACHIPAVQGPESPTANPLALTWRVLAFISDRYLLSVEDAAVTIWDTSVTMTSSPAVGSSQSPWAHFTLPKFIGYADYHSILCLAGSRMDHGNQQCAVVYSVPLPLLGAGDSDQRHLHQEAEFPLLEGEQLKHMDPYAGRALFYRQPTSIHVLHWRDNNKRSTISIELEDPNGAWNGVTSLRFCGPYVLCFRVRSVEAYPIPTDAPTSSLLPMLRHQFKSVCFRSVSLSHVRESDHVYTVFMLANDMYQGMFHYRIRVTIAPVPKLSISLLAQGNIALPDPPPLIPGTTDMRYTMEDVVRRTFVSTWSLGSAGLRGVWVERQRGSIDRKVVAFTTHPRRLCAGTLSREQRGRETLGLVTDEYADALDVDEGAPPMEGKDVHVISSYDLRDDITMCAVSEWTGRIALCSRVGTISIL